MAKKNRDRVTNSNKAMNNVKPAELPNFDGVIVDFATNQNFWLKSFGNKEFTTYLKSSSDFSNQIYVVINKIIPYIQSNWKEIKNNSGKHRHCHTVSVDKYTMLEGLFEELYPSYNMEELQIWQFGVVGGTRLIASVSNESNGAVIRPLFLDYHHLIYPSVKNNQKDCSNYKFCPMAEFE